MSNNWWFDLSITFNLIFMCFFFKPFYKYVSGQLPAYKGAEEFTLFVLNGFVLVMTICIYFN